MTIPGGHGSRPDPDEQEFAHAVDASLALQQLLAAAAAPPSSAELKGRSRALAAFRAAHRRRRGATGGTPAEDAGARRTPLTRIGRFSAAQFTVACAALVVLLGGTAVAAAAGQLPPALQDAVSELFNGSQPAGDHPSPKPTGQPAPLSSGMHTLPPAPSDTASSPSPSGSPAAPSSASTISSSAAGHATAAQLAGLCRAYRAAGDPARLLSTPRFASLVDAAGGVAAVDGYCAELPATSGTGTPSSTALSAGPSTSAGTAVPSGTATSTGTALAAPPVPNRTGGAESGQASSTSGHPVLTRARSNGAQSRPAHRTGKPSNH